MAEEDSSNQRGVFYRVSAKIKSGYTRAARSPVAGVVAAIVLGVVVGVLVWKFKPIAPPYTTSKGPPLDPTAVITTFITLYGLFIGGFGVLIGFVAQKKVKKIEWLTAWRAAAISFLIVGVGMDLWRVLDSTNDLFIAATHGLDYPHLKDDITDFTIYFFINVFVIMFSIGVAVWIGRGSADK
jgi:hypothetical protein